MCGRGRETGPSEVAREWDPGPVRGLSGGGTVEGGYIYRKTWCGCMDIYLYTSQTNNIFSIFLG